MTSLLVAGCDGSREPAKPTSKFDVGIVRVQDRAGVLSAEQEIDLTSRSEALERATTDQLVIVTIPSLNGQDITKFSTDLGNQMGVGQAEKDNGVLIVVAPHEREVGIATGYGLEALLTDERSAKIIQLMLPKFRTGDMGGGIEVGAREVDALLRSDTCRPQYLNAERMKAAA